MGVLIARLAATALAIVTLAPLAASADSLDAVQGAWAIQNVTCSNAFVTDQGKIALKKRNDNILPGFIVDGRSVRGVASECNIVAFKPHPEGISLLLSCKSQIAVGNLKLTLKIPDPKTLIQTDPDFPEITTTFHKCD
jgi:hypothetical protein